MKDDIRSNRLRLFWIFIVELIVYGLLVVAYFLLVLQFLGEPLAELFSKDLPRYALVSLGIIIAQAVALDYVVTFLLDLLGLGRLK